MKSICKETTAIGPLSCNNEDFERPDQSLKSMPWELFTEDYLEIIEAVCDAWQKLIAKPETITSIGMRQWAHVGQAQ